RLAQRDNDNPRQPASTAAAEVRGQDRAQRRAIDSLVASTRGAAEGRAKHPLDYDRRHWLRRHQYVRWRDPDADPGSDRHPTDSATPTLTRQRYARRRAPPSSLAAIITRWASGLSPSKLQAFPAMTAS